MMITLNSANRRQQRISRFPFGGHFLSVGPYVLVRWTEIFGPWTRPILGGNQYFHYTVPAILPTILVWARAPITLSKERFNLSSFFFN